MSVENTIVSILIRKGDGDEKNEESKKDDDLLGRDGAQGDQTSRLDFRNLDGRADTAGLGRVHEATTQKGGAIMRGDGCIYPRGNMLWIAYSFRGKMFRESAHTTDEKVARKVLRQRLKQVERPGFVGSKEDRWTLADMKTRIKADYERRQNRSLKTVEYCFKHLEAAFQIRRVIDITTPVIQEYTANRLRPVPRGIGQPRTRLPAPRF